MHTVGQSVIPLFLSRFPFGLLLSILICIGVFLVWGVCLFVCGCFVFSKCFVGVVLGFLTSLICSKIVLFSGLCFGVWK